MLQVDNGYISQGYTWITSQLQKDYIEITARLHRITKRLQKVVDRITERLHNDASGQREVTMETEKAAESLRALATTDENRSKIGRLRELHQYIEDAKAAGVSMEKILETLNANGLQMKMASFKSMLHRIRNEKGKTPAARAATPTPKNETKVEAGQVEKKAVQGKDSPAPVGTKVGEPKRFDWNPTQSEKPEW